MIFWKSGMNLWIIKLNCISISILISLFRIWKQELKFDLFSEKINQKKCQGIWTKLSEFYIKRELELNFRVMITNDQASGAVIYQNEICMHKTQAIKMINLN